MILDSAIYHYLYIYQTVQSFTYRVLIEFNDKNKDIYIYILYTIFILQIIKQNAYE